MFAQRREQKVEVRVTSKDKALLGEEVGLDGRVNKNTEASDKKALMRLLCRVLIHSGKVGGGGGGGQLRLELRELCDDITYEKSRANLFYSFFFLINHLMYPQLKMGIKGPDDSLAKAQFGLTNLKPWLSRPLLFTQHFLSTVNT